MARNPHSPSSSQSSENHSTENHPIDDNSYSVISPFTHYQMNLPKPIILIVPAGMDIIHAIKDLARIRDAVCVSIQTAFGFISEVNITNPFSAMNDVTIQGDLCMVSLAGFYNNSPSPSTSEENNVRSSFTIQYRMGNSLEIHGGVVGSRLIAAETVHVIVYVSERHEHP